MFLSHVVDCSNAYSKSFDVFFIVRFQLGMSLCQYFWLTGKPLIIAQTQYIHLGTAVYFQRHKTVTYCQQGDPFTLLCVVVYGWHKETSFVASAVIVYTDNLHSSRQTLWGIVMSAATFVTSVAPCRTLSELVGCPATFTLFLFRCQGVSCFLFHYRDLFFS